MKVFANGERQERPQPIVEVLDGCIATKPCATSIAIISVAFMAKILDDLVRFERKTNDSLVDGDIG